MMDRFAFSGVRASAFDRVLVEIALSFVSEMACVQMLHRGACLKGRTLPVEVQHRTGDTALQRDLLRIFHALHCSDIAREMYVHLTFPSLHHRCIGTPLGRIQQ